MRNIPCFGLFETYPRICVPTLNSFLAIAWLITAPLYLEKVFILNKPRDRLLETLDMRIPEARYLGALHGNRAHCAFSR
jgi:hypothetical protein